MKRLVFVLICTLSSLFAFAQPDYAKDYHPLINSAELAIVDSNYSLALITYQRAFQAVPRPFVKDYYNAAVVAAKLKEYKTAYRYLDSLAAKGVSKSFFQEHEGLKPLKGTQDWTAFINGYEQKQQQYRSSKNTEIKQHISSLLERDMQFRNMEGGEAAYADTIKTIDAINMAAIERIISRYGFPDENLTGRENPADTRSMVYPILWHHATKKDPYKKSFSNAYWLAVRNGQLNPHEAALLLNPEKEQGSWLGNEVMVRVVFPDKDKKDVFLLQTYGKKHGDIIATNRQKFGLGTLEDFKKKSAFNIYDKDAEDFVLTDYGRFMEKQVASDSEYRNLLNEYQPVK